MNVFSERSLRPLDPAFAVEAASGSDEQWEGLDFTLRFAEVPTTKHVSELERFLDAWYHVGVRGGYGAFESRRGTLHYMSEGDRRFQETEPEYGWWVDMGGASAAALEVLIRGLDDLRADGLLVTRLRIGR